MKNTHIISMIIMVAAGTLMASCNMEKENPETLAGDNAIRLAASVETKSAESTIATVTANGFKAVGIVSANGSTTNLFDSHPCAVQAVDGGFEYSGELKYWNATAVYDFAAYAGITDAAALPITTTDRMCDVSGQYLVSNTQDDLLLAYQHADMSARPASYPAVELRFRHALAAVEFKIYTAEGMSATLSDFSLSNIVVGGTFSIGSGSTPAVKNAINWTAADPQSGSYYSLVNAGTFNIPNSAAQAQDVYGVNGRKYKNGTKSFDGTFATVIPQTLTEQSVTFTIVSGSESVTTIKKLTSDNGKWEPGKKYIYTIKVEGAHVDLILVTTTEWDIVTGVAGDDIILTD